jgi:phosphopantothenoylcysteine decarboxylase / phosphopantothenate---cysteine ligase
MSRILITSGPTREYLDPVRYLSNGSSGRMGAALAAALLDAGHQVVIVSGPVETPYPAAAEVIGVVSTEEMLRACQKAFPTCDGLIAVAAPCDYRPVTVASNKIKKTGKPLVLELIETPDVVAELATLKTSQWIVGFALETEDVRLRAMQKLERKNCDLIVMNGPQAIRAANTQVEVLNRRGESLGRFAGSKSHVARQIVAVLGSQFPHSNR